MANSWLRLWHDMPNDPKWRTIARASGQSIALVQAVYLQLLVSASQNPVTDESGVTLHVTTVTKEDIASSLDVTEEEVESVTEAMQGRVLDGAIISGWEKRQALSVNYKNPGKPAKTDAERAKDYRDRKRQANEIERHVTNSNVASRDGHGVTEQIRIDKKRIDKELKDKTLLSGAGKTQPPTKKNAAGSYPEEFETLWHEYPKREGANPKNKAHSCWKARKLEGVSEEAMLEGTLRYRQYCEMRGQAGTEFVMQAQRFYGKERAFENDWQVNTGGLNHAKNTANTIGNNGESIAERQLRAGREQWARERGHTGVAPVGTHDQNLQHPVDSQEWQSSIGPLGETDWGHDE